MNQLGWTVEIEDPARRAEVCAELAARACDTFNLCASVGCGCFVAGKPVVCSEETLTDVWVSRGPNWKVVVVSLDGVLKFDLYTTVGILQDEVTAFHRSLTPYGTTHIETRRF